MIEQWIALLKKGECISEVDVKKLCTMTKSILMEESNVQEVSVPAIICGDIHGQFFDLLELFKVGGDLPENNYVFMGDYVDRGNHSVETFLLLMCLKVKFPNNITLIRGNHESRQITQAYGFYEECIKKYGNANPWKYCVEVFDYLNLAAVIDGKVFCVHGGLSPALQSIDQIQVLERVQEVPHQGPYCDLMWSDPEDVANWTVSPRGAGYLFGAKASREFCYFNGLSLICRAHQLVMEGYKFHFAEKSVVTVWSAPNYCYRCGNVASVLKLDEYLAPDFKIFNEVTSQHYREVGYKMSLIPYFI